MPEPAWNNPRYLQAEQYRDASNLNARMTLHERFSSNPKGWHNWVFEQIELNQEACLLEAGCGPGALWTANAGRIPPGWKIILSDFSLGMAHDAQHNLNAKLTAIRFAVCDAQMLPFPTGCFDAAIANHMLYHVPDRGRAIGELHRTLKPGGCLCAATNGQEHMHELTDLLRRFDSATCEPSEARLGRPTTPFSLENGAGQLREHFDQVSLRCYEDALEVTEAEPLVAYVASMLQFAGREDRLRELGEFISSELERRGTIHITKEAGLFVAIKA